MRAARGSQDVAGAGQLASVCSVSSSMRRFNKIYLRETALMHRMCAAQLIFIGPIGRSYTPQGGNVSPTLVRRACPTLDLKGY